MPEPRRDIMAPDNEPTDEELAVVMREALAVAMAREAASDEWMRQQLAEAVREAEARHPPVRKR
ncbi:MAG: hypothetical protein U0359_14665 [Byssovorax sp.]